MLKTSIRQNLHNFLAIQYNNVWWCQEWYLYNNRLGVDSSIWMRIGWAVSVVVECISVEYLHYPRYPVSTPSRGWGGPGSAADDWWGRLQHRMSLVSQNTAIFTPPPPLATAVVNRPPPAAACSCAGKLPLISISNRAAIIFIFCHFVADCFLCRPTLFVT